MRTFWDVHSAYYNGVLNFLRFHISWSFLDFFLIVFSVTDVQSVIKLQVRSTANVSSEIFKVDMAPADSQAVVKQFCSCMLTNEFLDLPSLSHNRLRTFISGFPDDPRSQKETSA